MNPDIGILDAIVTKHIDEVFLVGIQHLLGILELLTLSALLEIPVIEVRQLFCACDPVLEAEIIYKVSVVDISDLD